MNPFPYHEPFPFYQNILIENRTPGHDKGNSRRKKAHERNLAMIEKENSEKVSAFFNRSLKSILSQIMDGSPAPKIIIPLELAGIGLRLDPVFAPLKYQSELDWFNTWLNSYNLVLELDTHHGDSNPPEEESFTIYPR